MITTINKMHSLKPGLLNLSYEDQLKLHESVQASRLIKKETRRVRSAKKVKKKKLLELAKKAKSPEEIEELLTQLRKQKLEKEKGKILN